ncbi:hypothetical protein PPUJ20028_50200 [Pseudomonas putida]|uniref:Gamma-glutamyltransferase n=1 Tax=Pseudomonas putida TaxID=303 RepID=A0AA37VX76_PSEPU|nr:hypothetical protein PPUJ20028_50200 [Pseudomonas putida]GLO38194.1 hypothetical protein PPUN14671_50310 [Pseudomonas putida]
MGLWEAHKKFGKLPWSELLTPAIGYAKNGFKVAEKQYQYRNDAQGMFKTATNFNDYFGNMKVGELFKQPEMAQTLERIADKGVSEFYQGKTADLLVAQMQADKRMLSSMSPSLMTRDGKVELVIGTPGGSRIFTSIFQVMNNLYDYGMPLDKAVAAQRVHHQLLPKDTIYFDAYAPLTGPEADKLKKMGYVLEDQGWEMGDIQAIHVEGTKLETASDPRGRGVGMIVK